MKNKQNFNFRCKVHLIKLWTKYLKKCYLKIFLFFSPVSLTLLINIHSRISPRIFEKIQNGPNGILRGPRDTDLWKNLKAKISCQTPFAVREIPPVLVQSCLWEEITALVPATPLRSIPLNNPFLCTILSSVHACHGLLSYNFYCSSTTTDEKY